MSTEREVKPGSDRHIRRIENEKRKNHRKASRNWTPVHHRGVGDDVHDDDFDPQDLVKAFNAGNRIDY